MTSSTPRPVQSVTNTELYNRWAKVYDTDGNILQSIDDLLIQPLLSHAFSLLSPSHEAITITELGCGTGRNTAKLLLPSSAPGLSIAQINALDLSPGMLEVAQQRCSSILASSSQGHPNIQFLEFDALNPGSFPEVSKLKGKADLLISTLVLEHLPVDVFFATIKHMLKPGGVVVLTNMHSEMGIISQAGFVDEKTGEKVRGDSFAHTVEEVVNAAGKEGIVVVGEFGERGVEERDVEDGVVGKRGRKWIGVKVWYGCVMRLDGSIGSE